MMYHGNVLAGAGAKVYDIAPVVCLLFHLLAQPAAAVVGCFPVAGSGWWRGRSGLRIVAMAEARRELSVPAHSAREVVRKELRRSGWLAGKSVLVVDWSSCCAPGGAGLRVEKVSLA